LWNPWVATAVYNAVVLVWHLPALYSQVLRSEPLHALQHASFLGSAVVFWSVLLSPAPRHPTAGQRLVMVGLSAVAQFVPGFVLSVADRVLYAPYLEAPRLWGWSPLDDQRWAGVLMWVVTNLAYAAAALWVAAVGLRSAERGAGG
jgi:putative membrane protein